jgi:hypothetical protein
MDIVGDLQSSAENLAIGAICLQNQIADPKIKDLVSLNCEGSPATVTIDAPTLIHRREVRPNRHVYEPIGAVSMRGYYLGIRGYYLKFLLALPERIQTFLFDNHPPQHAMLPARAGIPPSPKGDRNETHRF